jgi:hypothetical protein
LYPYERSFDIATETKNMEKGPCKDNSDPLDSGLIPEVQIENLLASCLEGD